ncbi:MAG: hypothetical protein ACUVQY_10455 [Thermoproteota archaeon]
MNWPEEIRLFIKRRIREVEAEENMDRIIKGIRRIGSVPKEFSTMSVREDRESG